MTVVFFCCYTYDIVAWYSLFLYGHFIRSQMYHGNDLSALFLATEKGCIESSLILKIIVCKGGAVLKKDLLPKRAEEKNSFAGHTFCIILYGAAVRGGIKIGFHYFLRA